MDHSSSPAQRLAPPGRNLGIDTARGLALFGMMVTHIVPFLGPGDELLPSVWFAGRSSALFAVLAGFSVVLSTDRILTGSGERRWAAASLGLVVRGLLISVIGLLLGVITSSIAVILVFYGLMFCLAPLFLRLPTLALGLLAPTWMIAAPVISMWLRRAFDLHPNYIVPTPGDLLSPGPLLTDLVLTGYYPVLPWLGYLFLGMFLARLPWRSAAAAAIAVLIGLGTAVLSKAVSSLLLTAGGRGALEAVIGPVAPFDRGSLEEALHTGSYGVTPNDSWWWLAIAGPHSATPFDLLHTSGVAVAVIGACTLAAMVLGRRSAALSPLSAPGSMPLTIYAGHIVFLEFTALSPFSAGVDLITHIVFAIVFAIVWKLTVSPRGPLEGLVSSAVSSAREAVQRDREAQGEPTR
ncbi:heparan-alpha-glucosaminide N-acetyltransferase domain-containing protein [Brevibacterium daeguense]|uniref:Heparan-alpha-glucosaminide N-acetyltransferase domain-containing protein n=1 Tax=Brevibacterium daeguense TaxID=909936 RepID=A0ABP8EM42_9MICO|nr:heparan-alpha-glucosaminide N-acetyltransferase domain-containing protein [Brevibacterium daeguense]